MTSHTSSNRFAALDVLRVVAVFGVVLAHFMWSESWIAENLGGSPADIFGGLAKVGAYGFLGVHLFFVISGAVISRSAVSRTAREFVTARFLRLMPALVIAVPLTALLVVVVEGADVATTIRSVATNLVLLPSLADAGWLNPVFWTLVIEASFYGIVALVVLIWGSTITVLWRFAWVWLGAVILASKAHNELLDTLILADWAPFFIAGILIGTARTRGDKAAAIIGLVAATLLAVESTLATMNPDGRSVSIICVIVALIVSVVAASVWWSPLSGLHSPGWAFVGTMTYSLYLFHVIPGRMLAGVLLELGLGVVGSYLISLSAAVGLSFIVTKYAEPRIRRALKSALTA